MPGECRPRAHYFAKTVEVIFKRSNHRPPFAFSRVAFRVSSWAKIAIWPLALSRVAREVRCPGAADPVLGRYARLHWSISDAKISEVLGLGAPAETLEHSRVTFIKGGITDLLVEM